MTTDPLDLAITNVRNVREALKTTVRESQLEPLNVAIDQIIQGKPRPTSEPEIITGKQAVALPIGSQVIRADPDDQAKVMRNAEPFTIGRFCAFPSHYPYRVLYRAPKPESTERTFHVGDHLHNDQDVTDVPTGTAVRTTGGRFAAKHLGGWQATSLGFYGHAVSTQELLGARIIDLPSES